MTPEQEQAVTYHHRGCNCAQSVLLLFCEKYGLDFASGMRVAAGLGGGFRCGELCGAISGAVLAIGLRHAAIVPEDLAQKEICYQKTEEFVETFRARFGKVACRELLEEKGRDICDELIAASVDMMMKLGY